MSLHTTRTSLDYRIVDGGVMDRDGYTCLVIIVGWLLAGTRVVLSPSYRLPAKCHLSCRLMHCGTSVRRAGHYGMYGREKSAFEITQQILCNHWNWENQMSAFPISIFSSYLFHLSPSISANFTIDFLVIVITTIITLLLFSITFFLVLNLVCSVRRHYPKEFILWENLSLSTQ